MSNFIYYEKLEDYEEQVKKAKLCDEKDKEIERLNNIINELKEDIVFCINDMKNEYACTDSRTNRELHTMVKILEESLDKLQELKGSDK